MATTGPLLRRGFAEASRPVSPKPWRRRTPPACRQAGVFAPPVVRSRLVIPEIFNRGSFLIIISSLFFSTSAFALQIPDKPEHYVNDYIGLLSPSARGRIEKGLEEFEKATSNQVVVAIFASLEGGSLEDFSIRLAEKWKMGTKKHDNGVILLIFKSDRKVRMEVGYGLEGALPDVTANQIIQNDIVPNFRAGNFDAGVEKAVGDILLATRGEYTAPPPSDDSARIKLLFFGFIILLYLFLLLSRSGRTYSSRGLGGGFFYIGGSGGGRSGGGSGGFGGGGGGGFGGGDSSGSW